jgi:dihydrofolate reductase
MDVKCSAYVATSVDGFIAGADGDIEWLLRPEYATSGMSGLGYDDFIATVDAVVMGRNTFEKVVSMGYWDYRNLPVVVLTTRALAIPPHLAGTVRVDAGTPEDVVTRLAEAGKRHLYVDGGQTIQRFLRAGLITELTITRIPLLLGRGIPLFGELGVEIPLRLIAATPSENGFVQVRYAVGAGD